MACPARLTPTIGDSSNSGRIVQTRGKICTAGKDLSKSCAFIGSGGFLKDKGNRRSDAGNETSPCQKSQQKPWKGGQRFDSKNDCSASVLNHVAVTLGIETLSFQFLDERGSVQLQELGGLTGHAVGFAKRLPD